MKGIVSAPGLRANCRPPHGGRGLKLLAVDSPARLKVSPPTRGAWIEIPSGRGKWDKQLSPPTRGAWIEIPIWR